LFVTELDECDFLQCEISEYATWEDFVADADPVVLTLSKKSGLEKGCVIQLILKDFVPDSDKRDVVPRLVESDYSTHPTEPIDDVNVLRGLKSKYLYPPRTHMTPDEIDKWIADEVKNFPSNKLSKDYAIHKTVYFRFDKVSCHLIKKDAKWFESKIPMLKQFWDYVLFYRSNERKLNDLVKFVKEVGIKNTAMIFERINKEYVKANPDSDYEPLYQEKNEWREKFDKWDDFWARKNAMKKHA